MENLKSIDDEAWRLRWWGGFLTGLGIGIIIVSLLISLGIFK